MTDTVRKIDLSETAKLVRTALKKAFPTTTFSVRSTRYSGGSSLHVDWTDGPTLGEVQNITHVYQGATFDPMIDLKSYQDGTLNGERVQFAPDYVQCQRSLSEALLTECAQKVAEQYHVAPPSVTVSRYRERNGKEHTHAYLDVRGEPLDRYSNGTVANWASTLGDKAIQLANATSKK